MLVFHGGLKADASHALIEKLVNFASKFFNKGSAALISSQLSSPSHHHLIMFSRQARSSLRGHVSRAGSSSSKSQIRFASSSSSSSSSTTKIVYGAIPVGIIAAVAAFSIYGHSNQESHSLEPAKRKEYWQRMAVEERKQRQAKAVEEEEEDSKSTSSDDKSSVQGNEGESVSSSR